MTIKTEQEITLPARALAEALRSVAFACSSHEMLWYLQGVYLHEEAGDLYVVASDSSRLARRIIKGGGNVPAGFAHIIHKAGVPDLIRSLEKEDGAATLFFGDGKVRHRNASYGLVPQGLQYVDLYRPMAAAICERAPAAVSNFVAESLLQSLPESPSIAIDYAGDLIPPRSRYDGETSITLPTRQLVEALKHLSGDAKATFFSPDTPAVFRNSDWRNLEFISVMPLKIENAP